MRRSSGPGAVPRVVLDTNVVLSSLLFEGPTSRIVSLWQSNRFCFLMSREILEEYLRALAYPKFGLTEKEIKALLEEEILPFVQTIPAPSLQRIPSLRDPQDRKFLACARSGKADFLTTGDKGLLAIGQFGNTQILNPKKFLEHF